MAWYMPLCLLETRSDYSRELCYDTINLYNYKIRPLSKLEYTLAVRHPMTRADGEKVLWVAAYNADTNRLVVTDASEVKEVTMEELPQIVKSFNYTVRYCEPTVKLEEVDRSNTKSQDTFGVAHDALIPINNHMLLNYRKLPKSEVQKFMISLRTILKRLMILGDSTRIKIVMKLNTLVPAKELLKQFPLDVYDYHELYEAIFKLIIENGIFWLSMRYDLKFLPSSMVEDDADMAVDFNNQTGGICVAYKMIPQQEIRIVSGASGSLSAPIVYIYKDDWTMEGVILRNLTICGFYEQILFGQIELKVSISIISALCDTLDMSNITAIGDNLSISISYAANLKKIVLPKLKQSCIITISDTFQTPEVYFSTGERVGVDWKSEASHDTSLGAVRKFARILSPAK